MEPTCELLYQWKQNNLNVDYICLDNAGENIKLQQQCMSSDWKLNIKFEFTARDTPQFNHLAELGFAVLANKGRSLMYAAHVPQDIQYRLWREAFQTATLLDGLVVITLNR